MDEHFFRQQDEKEEEKKSISKTREENPQGNVSLINKML